MKTYGFQRRWRHRLTRLCPGQLVIQITDKCNATCPQCSMRIASDFKRHSIGTADMFKIIDTAGRHRIKAISFTGGEPLLMIDDLCRYLERAGNNHIPFIRTGTNGFMFAKSHRPDFTDKIHTLANRLAATPVRNFWISMDSSYPDVHESMRGFDGVVNGVAAALPIFHEAGLFPSVNLGINRNLGGTATAQLAPEDFLHSDHYEAAVYFEYSQAFSKFFKQAVDLGFTIVNACYPMSIDPEKQELSPVYQASTADHIVSYRRSEKKMIFQALHDTLEKFRHTIRIFTPQSALNALINQYSDSPSFTSAPCQGGINYYFIDAASRHTFPCGYRGREDYGRYWQMTPAAQVSEFHCRQCDWECFRDPSELVAPVLDLLSAPVAFAGKLIKNPFHYTLWAKDLLYYHACDYFNGRVPPDYRRLKRFEKQ